MKYLIVFSIVGISILFFIFNPEESSFGISCPFKMITSYDCPGCGSQRVFHQLLHLNFKQAFVLNPLIFVVVPYIILGFLLNLKVLKHKFPKLQRNIFSIKAILAWIFLMFLFLILRNTEVYHQWISKL